MIFFLKTQNCRFFPLFNACHNPQFQKSLMEKLRKKFIKYWHWPKNDPSPHFRHNNYFPQNTKTVTFTHFLVSAMWQFQTNMNRLIEKFKNFNLGFKKCPISKLSSKKRLPLLCLFNPNFMQKKIRKKLCTNFDKVWLWDQEWPNFPILGI